MSENSYRVTRLLRLCRGTTAAVTFLVLAFVQAAAGATNGRDAREDSLAVLTCIVLDQDTHAPLPFRGSVTDCDGNPRHPEPAEECLYHAPTWEHSGCFYAEGQFSVNVPLGETFVGAGHGFERGVIGETVDVAGDTTITFGLPRVADMQVLDWYPGDSHSHMFHSDGVYDVDPADAVFAGRCEGLRTVSCLDNTYHFTGGPSSESTADCIVYFSEELRSSIFGHTAVLGLSSLVDPAYCSWSPMIADLADLAHAQPGAAVIAAHPVTMDTITDVHTLPAGAMQTRELPIDVIGGGRIDGFEVLSYSNWHNDGRETELWYQLLNCGFRLPCCGGSDACVNRLYDRPLGGYRTYVQVDTDSLSYGDWVSSLKAGRTFVTNGPLFTEIEVADHACGDSVALSGVDSLMADVEIGLASAFPLKRCDVVVNGVRAKSFFFESGQCSADTTLQVMLRGSSWVAARVFGEDESWYTMGDSLFAHTGPVYFTMNGNRIAVKEDADVFIDWMRDLHQIGRDWGEWDTPADSTRFFTAVEDARLFYSALVPGGDTGVSDPEPPPSGARSVLRAAPNPFAERVFVRAEMEGAGDAEAVLDVYSTSGRLVRRIPCGGAPANDRVFLWDGRDAGGDDVASGIYLLRVTTGNATAHTKVVVLR